MFLKFRYRLGYETLCREVSDSITWRRFCRIPIDGAGAAPDHADEADHPLRDRRGGRAATRRCWPRPPRPSCCAPAGCAPTPPWSPANVAYPTDSGLLAKAVRRIAVDRPADPGRRRRDPDQGAGPQPGRRAAGARDRGEAAAARARRAVTRPRPRSGGSPASWPTWPNAPPPTPSGCWSTPAGRCAGPGSRPQRWPRPASDAAAGRRRGRLARAVNDLTELLDGDPADRRADPAAAGRDHPGRRDPAGQPARRATPARSPRAGSASRSSSATRPRSSTTTTASCWTTPSSRATRRRPATGPRGRAGHRAGPVGSPRTVTADRGYGEASVENALHRPRRPHRRDPPQGQTRQGPTSRRTPTGVPPNRQVANRQRGPDQQPSNAATDGTAPAWTASKEPGSGPDTAVLAHNLVKIAALAG